MIRYATQSSKIALGLAALGGLAAPAAAQTIDGEDAADTIIVTAR